MDMDKYLEIKERFCALENPENAITMKQYMKNHFEFYGLPTPKRRKVYQDVIKQDRKTKQVDWKFLEQCFEDEHREFQYLVGDYLRAMITCLTFEDISRIKQFIVHKSWWDTIDQLYYVIGEIGLRDTRVNDLMLEWASDENIWLRRIAIEHQLNRKEQTDVALLEKILIANLNSKEFFINKAIGWSLREYAKTNPDWVANFIEQHHDQMSTLSMREASKHIKNRI